MNTLVNWNTFLEAISLFLIKETKSYYICYFIITKMCCLPRSPVLIMIYFIFCFLKKHSRLVFWRRVGDVQTGMLAGGVKANRGGAPERPGDCADAGAGRVSPGFLTTFHSCLPKSLLRDTFLALFCFISGAEGLINHISQFMAFSYSLM